MFTHIIEKSARKVIIKRGTHATDYFSYCEEVGCDVWDILHTIESISDEPVCLWLSLRDRKPGTSEYVQGAEVALDYDGIVPEGFNIIELPAATYLMFQGEPFAEEEYAQAILELRDFIEKYDLSGTEFSWDNQNPRIQLEPIGTRGYIELVPIQ